MIRIAIGIFQVRFWGWISAPFWMQKWPIFSQKWLKIPDLKFLSELEPSSANTCSRLVSLCKLSYPQIIKVIPKLLVTSNSSMLYFLYGARSYAEEFNHLKLQLCRTEFPISINCRGFSQFHGPWTQIKIQCNLSKPDRSGTKFFGRFRQGSGL